jgi:hypothetical protein
LYDVLVAEIPANRALLNDYYSEVLNVRATLSQFYTAQSLSILRDSLFKSRQQLDRSFLAAKAEGLPVATLIKPNGDLMNATNHIISGDLVSADVNTAVRAADEMLSIKPSVLRVTLLMMWPWLAVAWVPFLVALVLWLRWRLRFRWYRHR